MARKENHPDLEKARILQKMVETLTALAKHGMVCKRVAEKFQDNRRARSPDISDSECAALIRDKGQTLGAGICNPLGVILARGRELLRDSSSSMAGSRSGAETTKRGAKQNAERELCLEYQQFREAFAVAAHEHLPNSDRLAMVKTKR